MLRLDDTQAPEIIVQNPLCLLKRGFATYTEQDAKVLAASCKEPREDIERDRRVPSGEEEAIIKGLRGDDLTFLLLLALETAMRMRECYTLELSQINLGKRTIYPERSKSGDNRQVPLSSVACTMLAEHIDTNRQAIMARGGRLFPCWSGETSVRELDRITAEVSHIFR